MEGVDSRGMAGPGAKFRKEAAGEEVDGEEEEVAVEEEVVAGEEVARAHQLPRPEAIYGKMEKKITINLKNCQNVYF